MKHRGQAHEFALYVAELHTQQPKKGQAIALVEHDLVHRISRILRLDEQDQLILFDDQLHLRASIEKISKHIITVRIGEVTENMPLRPRISLWLPLLKREAFEQAVYSAVELGANEIQLVSTQKEQRHWRDKELKRLEHIMIAAAEQSKQFALPAMSKPIPLLQAQPEGRALFFDPQGEPFFQVMQELHQQRPTELAMFIGPEGDLTEAEKFYLQQQQVQFIRLTPTILRAQQAVAVGLGALRSICSSLD